MALAMIALGRPVAAPMRADSAAQSPVHSRASKSVPRMPMVAVGVWILAAFGAFLLINAKIATIVYLPDAPILVGVCGMARAYALVGLGCAAVFERGRARALMCSGR